MKVLGQEEETCPAVQLEYAAEVTLMLLPMNSCTCLKQTAGRLCMDPKQGVFAKKTAVHTPDTPSSEPDQQATPGEALCRLDPGLHGTNARPAFSTHSGCRPTQGTARP
jgi:hypothetical protein